MAVSTDTVTATSLDVVVACTDNRTATSRSSGTRDRNTLQLQPLHPFHICLDHSPDLLERLRHAERASYATRYWGDNPTDAW